tara:strand:+ start:1875 stop:2546 length:672 start_codon:yes stop_codon:yes gene_type:complete
MKIVVYTHSDVNWVWEPWLTQTSQYFPTAPKVVFLDEGASFDEEYKAIEYDDTIPYNQRVTACLDRMEDEDVILFSHEDMFLYDEPDYNLLNVYIELIKSGEVDLIKLLRNGDGLVEYDRKLNLYYNQPQYGFAIQPTLAKVKTLKRIYRDVPGNTIWEFEANAQREVTKWGLTNLCVYDGALKRGGQHWDSYTYPYIATAVVKGKWNTKEYSKELKDIGVCT